MILLLLRRCHVLFEWPLVVDDVMMLQNKSDKTLSCFDWFSRNIPKKFFLLKNKNSFSQ